MASLSAQRVGALSFLTFSPSDFGLYANVTSSNQVVPTSPREVLAAANADAALDGPMFDVCPGQQGVPSGNAAYAVSHCDRLEYAHHDETSGLIVPSQYPTRGITISVKGGQAVAMAGDNMPAGSTVAIQLYPALLLNGEVKASATIDTDRVWRAGVGIMNDGSMGFAVGNMSMFDFANAMKNAGFSSAGYTDGGGSTALVTDSGVTGSSEGRRVASWMIVRKRGLFQLPPSMGGGGVPESVGIAAGAVVIASLVGGMAYFLLSKPK